MIVDAGKKAVLDLAIAANQFKYLDFGDDEDEWGDDDDW